MEQAPFDPTVVQVPDGAAAQKEGGRSTATGRGPEDQRGI